MKVTKLLKARENAGDQVVIGWECGARFMDQSQSEVKQNQQISGNFPYSLLYLQSCALLVTHEVFISCVQWNKNLKTFLVVGTIFCALPEGRKGVSIDTFSVKKSLFTLYPKLSTVLSLGKQLVLIFVVNLLLRVSLLITDKYPWGAIFIRPWNCQSAGSSVADIRDSSTVTVR